MGIEPEPSTFSDWHFNTLVSPINVLIVLLLHLHLQLYLRHLGGGGESHRPSGRAVPRRPTGGAREHPAGGAAGVGAALPRQVRKSCPFLSASTCNSCATTVLHRRLSVCVGWTRAGICSSRKSSCVMPPKYSRFCSLDCVLCCFIASLLYSSVARRFRCLLGVALKWLNYPEMRHGARPSAAPFVLRLVFLLSVTYCKKKKKHAKKQPGFYLFFYELFLFSNCQSEKLRWMPLSPFSWPKRDE